MTAPTPPAVAIADLLEYLDDGGLQFDGQPLPDAAASELLRLQAENERLRAERDEADRRAGAAERSAAAFHETNQRFEQVRRRMKEQWGVHDNVSFDLVWQQALDAKQALAELEARKPLPLSDEQIDDLHGEANRGFDIGHEEYFKAFRDAERAHGIKET